MYRSALAGSAALLSCGALWYLYPQAVVPRDVTSPRNIAFLIALGVGDKFPTRWNGTITATGTQIRSLSGWRFAANDAVMGVTGWRLGSRTTPAVSGTGPMAENGIIVVAADGGGDPSFAVTTMQGNFSFTATDVKFGPPVSYLNGRAMVMTVPSPLALTPSIEEDDFPASAQSGDDIWLSYVEFVHGDRSLATRIGTATTITDFRFLARPAGGDQVFLLHYSRSKRVWSGPVPITSPGEDIFRTAVAVDGSGLAWVFYSAGRDGNHDIYARSYAVGGAPSDEVRITSDPGTDLAPAAATDASGRVWVAWQGYRKGNLEILAAAQTSSGFTPESILSSSAASDWDPAIAAAANGDVAISWDTYDKGDYDVYVRRAHFGDKLTFEDPIAVAASPSFEARSSLAYDSSNRLWIAYETSGMKWGKDYGTYDTTGMGLYQNHTIQVRLLIGSDIYTTSDDIAKTLPGVPAAQLFQSSSSTPVPTLPDPTLAGKRPMNSHVNFSQGVRNSFPRLAIDAAGAVYLAFRHTAGSGLSTSSATGQSIGSNWIGELVWFDGAKWNGPGLFARSDGLNDNRPAISTLVPGRLLIAQVSDHRLSPKPNGTPQADGANSDIFALEIAVERTLRAPQLVKIGTVTPSAPDDQTKLDQAATGLMDSTPLTIGSQKYTVLRGDFHRHTELSFDGVNDGPLEDAYRYSIDAAALRWSGCCDHDNGSGREYSWWIIQKHSDAYALDSAFVPMYYYERSVAYPEGHRNVMFTRRGIRPLPRLPKVANDAPFAPAPDTTMLYQYLSFFAGISASHTSATDQGTDWRNNDPLVEPMVEIYQGDRQSYEMPLSPRSNSPTDAIDVYEPKGYVSAALAMGYKLGFEASSDHLSTHISFSNVWVTDMTREAVLDAVKKRHVYGSTDYILADFHSGSNMMGDSFTNTGGPTFSVKLSGTAAFSNISVVKDGTVAYSTSGDKTVSFTWQDTSAQKGKISYYYVRGLQSDGNVVWVSPMWVTIQ